jgi:hypothetical protein
MAAMLRNQLMSGFQLVKIWLTILDQRLTQSDRRRDRAHDVDGCASSRSRRSGRHGPIGHDDMFPLFTTSSDQLLLRCVSRGIARQPALQLLVARDG